MPRNHKTQVAYELRIGTQWVRLPIGARAETTTTGYLRVSMPTGLVTYYPPREFRIVPVAKGTADEA